MSFFLLINQQYKNIRDYFKLFMMRPQINPAVVVKLLGDDIRQKYSEKILSSPNMYEITLKNQILGKTLFVCMNSFDF